MQVLMILVRLLSNLRQWIRYGDRFDRYQAAPSIVSSIGYEKGRCGGLTKRQIIQINVPITGTFHIFVTEILAMRVIAKKTLRDFWSRHEDCEQQLKAWYKEASDVIWKNPNDIQREYPSACFLEGNRVVFNIKGN